MSLFVSPWNPDLEPELLEILDLIFLTVSPHGLPTILPLYLQQDMSTELQHQVTEAQGAASREEEGPKEEAGTLPT